MLKIIFWLIISVSVFACAGCASCVRIDGPFEGRVVDADTNLPIEGAVVHCAWRQLSYFYPMLFGISYYDSDEVLTNKDGGFKMPGQGLLVMTKIHRPWFTIFKAGYRELDCFQWSSDHKDWSDGAVGVVWKGGKPIFRLKRMAMEERLKRVIPGPGSAPEKKTKLFHREMNKENLEIGRDKDSLYPEELLK